MAFNEWRPALSADRNKLSTEFTNEQLALGYAATSNFNTWADQFSFVDIDRVWFSSDVPSTNLEKTSFSHEGNNNVSLSEKDFTITFNNNLDETVSLDGIRITKDNILLDKTEYSVSSGVEHNVITVTFANTLAANSEYGIVLPDNLVDVYGNLYSGNRTLTFNTKLYEIGDIVIESDGKRASVEILGIVPTDIVLILSEDNGKMLRQVDMSSEVINNTITVDLTEEPVSGSILKVFLWDSIGNLSPYASLKELAK